MRLGVLSLILMAAVFFGCERAARTANAPSSSSNVVMNPSPNPTCWIYEKIFPPTTDAYKREHVTLAEQHLIEKWAGSVNSHERSLVRWIRDPKDASIYVFVATPQSTHVLTEWQALNTNMAVDVYNCELVAVPGA
jgi:hypothetical protein